MFELSFAKLFVIAVVALIVLGPERLPAVARMAGTIIGCVQRFLASVKAEVNAQTEDAGLNTLKEDIQSSVNSVRTSMQDAMSEVQKSVSSLQEEVTTEVKAISEEIKSNSEIIEAKEISEKLNDHPAFEIVSVDSRMEDAASKTEAKESSNEHPIS